MQNGNYGNTTTQVIGTRTDYAGQVPILVTAPTKMELRYFKRNMTRVRPPALHPRYGTAADSSKRDYYLLQVGTRDVPSAGVHRDYGLVNVENLDIMSSLGNLNDLTELKPLIMNKIREDIYSGKSQLAVDLVELRKTKDMFGAAGIGLLQAFRDLRRGRPFANFIRNMRKEGYRDYAGRRWLEYIYGWAPTVSGAFETADVLAKELRAGAISVGTVKARLKTSKTIMTASRVSDILCRTSAKGVYQFTISDPKLLRLSQLGLTNPLAIAWELTPWSFVFDWFVDVGGYINRMDMALGLSDIYWQYGCFQDSIVHTTYSQHPTLPGHIFNTRKGIMLNRERRHTRHAPSSVIHNTFKGIKAFTNESVRLTSALALINQQRHRIKRIL